MIFILELNSENLMDVTFYPIVTRLSEWTGRQIFITKPTHETFDYRTRENILFHGQFVAFTSNNATILRIKPFTVRNITVRLDKIIVLLVYECTNKRSLSSEQKRDRTRAFFFERKINEQAMFNAPSGS